MRPAPPADPPAGVAADEHTAPPSERQGIDAPGTGSHPRPRLGTAARIAVAVVALGLVGASVAYVLSKSPRVTHPPLTKPVASPTVPPTPAFAFTEANLHALPSEPGVSTTAATSVLDSVKASLTKFYSLTLSTPSTWSRGVPDSAWDAFAPDVRARAKGDAASLALGNQLPSLETVAVSSATLDVSVLLDPSGHATAATAVVSIQATGLLKTAQRVTIGVDAAFVLRRLDQTWLVTGWPDAHLTTAPAPTVSPTPEVGPSGSPGASAPGATPETSP
jgi:hypothetical protein